MRRIEVVLAGAVAAAAALGAMAYNANSPEACGPSFPNQMLWNPSGHVLTPPTGNLAQELRNAPTRKKVRVGKRPAAARVITGHDLKVLTLKVEREDLAAALMAAGMSSSARLGRLSALRVARERVQEGLPVGTITPPLPTEFQLYLEGAAHHRAGKAALAAASWRAVLELPAAQRRYRSTWAAWMLAQQARGAGKAADAVRLYRQVRSLAVAGMLDSLGLVVSSLGWEARIEWDRGHKARAIALYAVQAGLGDRGAASSLSTQIPRLLADPKAARSAAKNPASLHAVTAWLVSRETLRGGDKAPAVKRGVAWLAACDKAGVRHAQSAKLLAWSAFRFGRYAEAKKWLKMAPAKAGMTLWIQAKLALYEGRTKEGLALLRQAARAFGKSTWDDSGAQEYDPYSLWGYDREPALRVLAEAGTVALSQKDYVQALDLLFRSNFWDDAAYVAERVVSTRELVKYVRSVSAKTAAVDAATLRSLRRLLGRRLIRQGKVKQAIPYLGATLAKAGTSYRRHHTAAKSKRGSKKARALALWSLAKTTRDHGMELLGMELEPDWANSGGQFDQTSVSKVRAALVKLGVKFGPSPDEVKRAKKTAAKISERFHYRYLAADLGWQAAALLNDNTKLKAAILCQAGSWLKYRNPTAADRYYKALVNKNPTVNLAVVADSLRWFPVPCGAP